MSIGDPDPFPDDERNPYAHFSDKSAWSCSTVLYDDG